MKATKNKQRGITLSGLLVWSIILIFLAIGGMKIVPAYVQNQTIKGIFDTISRNPDLQDATPKDIREAYSKRAMMNNINVVDVADIEISKVGSKLKLSAEYSVRIELVGNASLVLDFKPSSS